MNEDIVTSDVKNKGNNPYHIFDNAFLSACAWDKRLLIPLVNEIFKKNISEDATIEHLSNEVFYHKNEEEKEQLVKRITDALVCVEGGKYHLECESKNDGEILIRISEYDMQIALNDAKYKNHKVEMELPETAVIFLRNHHTLPEKGEIVYRKGGESISHRIPYFEVGKYTLEELTEKHLYLLFPFYLMRYEHAIKHNTSKKFELIEKEAEKVFQVLTEAYNSRILSLTEYEHILTLCDDVVKEISQGSKIRERLVNVMGTEVLKTAEERGMERGIEKGFFDATLKNIRNAMESLQLPFDKVCEILKIDDKEQFRKLI